MLVELTERYQKMYKLVTERITALGDYAVKIEQARKVAAETEVELAKLEALKLAIQQMGLLKRKVDAQVREVESKSSELKKFTSWAQPIENGFGFPTIGSKKAWDGFQALLDECSATERKAIRALAIADGERTKANFGQPNGKPTVDAPADAATFAKLHAFMVSKTYYPVQNSELHSRFKDDIFPQIEAAVKQTADGFNKELDELFDAKMEVITALAKTGGVSFSAPTAAGS